MKGILVAICLFCAHSVFGREIALGTDEHLMAGGEAEELRGPFTLDEARVSTSWKDLNGKAPNYGFTREVIWLRLQIHSDEQTERILYLDGWADHLDIYTVHDGVTVYHDAGLKARLTEEGKRFRRIFLPLVFDRGTTQIFFRMESSDTMRFPLEIFTRAHFERFRDTSIALISLYFGGMIVMAIYNLFLFAVTRDKSYSIYVLFVTSSLLYFAAQSGFILQFFPFVGEVALKRL
ncbi:MAG TPA: 7TM-DISM domain-containing protein, partial [Leptospiraceae bacterium]|nr:7TM-DISM domain-containing protein [Leptospiraceae bacterium]